MVILHYNLSLRKNNLPIFLQNLFTKNNFQKFGMNLGWWNFRINIFNHVIETIKIDWLVIVDVYEVFKYDR